MSKVSSNGVRTNVQNVLKGSVEKKRNFTETVELQIGLKVMGCTTFFFTFLVSLSLSLSLSLLIHPLSHSQFQHILSLVI